MTKRALPACAAPTLPRPSWRFAAAQRSTGHRATAQLTDDDRQLQSRVARLLVDTPPRRPPPGRRGRLLAALGLLIVLGWGVGMLGGETAIAWLARHGL